MFVSDPAPASLADGFSALATWTREGPSWEGLLAADAGFEVAWTVVEGRLDARPWLTPPNRRPRRVRSAGGSPRLRMLRLRPEAVRAWLGVEAADFVDGGSVDLLALGGHWRSVAEAETETALLEALARLAPPSPDPWVAASVARLREVRPPVYREIAREMGYSYEQWRRRMEAATGVSPKFLARYHRLKDASRLARRHPGMGMAEVAFRTGFASDCALAAEASVLSGRTFRGLVAGFDLPE